MVGGDDGDFLLLVKGSGAAPPPNSRLDAGPLDRPSMSAVLQNSFRSPDGSPLPRPAAQRAARDPAGRLGRR